MSYRKGKAKGKRVVPAVFLSSAVVRPIDDLEQQPLADAADAETKKAVKDTEGLVKQSEKIQKKSKAKQRDIESLIHLDDEEDDESEHDFSPVPDSFLPTALKVTDPKPRAPMTLEQKLGQKGNQKKKKKIPVGTARKGKLALPLLRELETMASQRKHDTFATFYESDGKPTEKLTFGEVWNQSGVVSYHLRTTWKLKKGQTVALVLDYGLNYVYTWLGCLRAGVVPLVVASPTPPNYEPGLTKLNALLHAAAPVALILTDSVVKYWKEEDESDRKSETRKMWPGFAKWKAVDKLPKAEPVKKVPMSDSSIHSIAESISSLVRGGSKDDHDEEPSDRGSFFQRISFLGGSQRRRSGSNASILSIFGGGGGKRSSEQSAQTMPRPSLRESIFGQDESEPLMAGTAFDEESLQPNDIACLQATSGSTADPKLVVVTFQALFESIKMTQRSLASIFDPHETLTGLSWVPPDHHIGLFLSMLCPFLSGCSMHYMSRLDYEESPKQWLELLSTYKIKWTVAPDNGYRLLIREFTKTLNSSKTIMTELDLSSLKILLNVGESPRFNTPTKFKKCFVPYFLPRDCLILTGYGLAEHVMPISWLEQKVFTVPTCQNFAMTKRVAVARKADLEQENITIIAVDPITKTPVKKAQMGEIWVSSPSLQYMPGYFKDKKLSKKIFRATFKSSNNVYLRTGDIGLFQDDHLYICCRKEDVLKTPQGIKFCPPDIEWFAEDSKPQVKPGCVAAFASVGGTVEIALEVFEGTRPFATKQLCQALSVQIPKFTRMKVSSVVAVPNLTLPRTPIGTVQRRHAKRALLKEEMPIIFDFPKRADRIAIPDNTDDARRRNSFNSLDGDETSVDSDAEKRDDVGKEESNAKGTESSSGGSAKTNDLLISQESAADASPDAAPLQIKQSIAKVPNTSAGEGADQTQPAVVPKWKQRLLERRGTTMEIPTPGGAKSKRADSSVLFGGLNASQASASNPKWREKSFDSKGAATETKPRDADSSETFSEAPAEEGRDSGRSKSRSKPDAGGSVSPLEREPTKSVASIPTPSQPLSPKAATPKGKEMLDERKEGTSRAPRKGRDAKPTEAAAAVSSSASADAPQTSKPGMAGSEKQNEVQGKESETEKPGTNATREPTADASISDADAPMNELATTAAAQSVASYVDSLEEESSAIAKSIASQNASGEASRQSLEADRADKNMKSSVSGAESGKIEDNAWSSSNIESPGVELSQEGSDILKKVSSDTKDPKQDSASAPYPEGKDVQVAEENLYVPSGPIFGNPMQGGEEAENTVQEGSDILQKGSSDTRNPKRDSASAPNPEAKDVEVAKENLHVTSGPTFGDPMQGDKEPENVVRPPLEDGDPTSSPLDTRGLSIEEDGTNGPSTADRFVATAGLPSFGAVDDFGNSEPIEDTFEDVESIEGSEAEDEFAMRRDSSTGFAFAHTRKALSRLETMEDDSQSTPTANAALESTVPVEGALVMSFGPVGESTPDATDDELDKILSNYLGPSFDSELSWEESGLTSTASVPLRNEIENAFHMTLPPDYQGRLPTPASLKEHVSDTKGGPLRTKKPALEVKKSMQLSWCTTGLIQALLMAIMFILFSVPAIPCWLVFEHLQVHPILFMLLAPIYTGTYSVIVVLAKWLVVGRYDECRMHVPSVAYLRWWFIDRLVHIWECWVGQFIVDTPLIWFFYVLMGAELSPSCQMAGFIREFDLVTIGANASMKYPCMKCRTFHEWKEEDVGPTMDFRRIHIAQRCCVHGMLSPGVHLDEGVCVQKLCVVPEGALVDEDVLLSGNPAYVADEADRREYPCCWVGVFKVFWVFAELAILYGIWEGALYFNPSPEEAAEEADFDYAYWALFVSSLLMLSLLSSIVLKFLLVGNRQEGKQRGCCTCYWSDWAADYHFNVVTLPFRFFAGTSRLCNLVLILHGMSIDFASKVEMESFPPSKMDLIRVRRSFLGKVSFDTKKDRVYYRTVIEDSSVGHGSHIQPDILLSKTLIRPFTLVSESVVYHKLDPGRALHNSCFLVLKETFSFLIDVILLAKNALTVLCAYLVWHFLFDFVSLETCVPILATSLMVQGLAWNWLFIMLAHLRYVCAGKKRPAPLVQGLHWLYISIGKGFQEWSFIKITYGSPIFNFLMRLARMSFEGRALYFGERIYDSPLIKLGDKTVIDSATIVGHNIVYDRFTFDLTYIEGIVHEQTLILPNGDFAQGSTKVFGPWVAVVPWCDATLLKRQSSAHVAMLRSPDAVANALDDLEAAMG